MKIAFYTLGCKLNQAETEALAGRFSEAGFQIVSPDDTADIYVANTCTVTHIADRKSRHWLRMARRRNPHALIIAAGCYAQRNEQELVHLADIVLDNSQKEHMLDIIVTSLSRLTPSSNIANSKSNVTASTPIYHSDTPVCHPGTPVSHSDTPVCHPGTPSLHCSTPLRHCERSEATSPISTIGRVRSLVKIQDGCHSNCTYCVVPTVRPHEYSLPAPRIIDEIKRKVATGYREVILTGTKVGCYRDSSPNTSEAPGADLRNLVQRILDNTHIERLHLSSLRPREISPELLSLWQYKRLCRHFHLALQSGSDTVLQRMRRGYSLDDYHKTINHIKDAIPDVAITTDIIVGFPGESDEEFQQSYSFCRQAGFANIHVFPFSSRPGTAAASMPHQVKDKVKQERMQRMLELSQDCRHSFCEQFTGRIMNVLWEKETKPGSGTYSGLTDNYIRVFVRSEKPPTNEIAPAKLLKFTDQGMWGKLVNENPG